LAAQFYGNPDLWFVIAEANGLKGSEELKAGQVLLVPSTMSDGPVSADKFKVYREGEIIGNQLPFLQSLEVPTPPDQCKQVGAIIAAVFVAIAALVLSVLTAGVAVPALAAVLGFVEGTVAATVFTVAATVVASAVIGFASSVASQEVSIGFGMQKSINWNQVGLDVGIAAAGALVSGFFDAASGASQVAAAARGFSSGATKLIKAAFTVGDTAAQIGLTYADLATYNNGRVQQPWMLALPVFGPVLGAASSSYDRIELDPVPSAGGAEGLISPGTVSETSSQFRDPKRMAVSSQDELYDLNGT